jgi:uncharacterized membrane protein
MALAWLILGAFVGAIGSVGNDRMIGLVSRMIGGMIVLPGCF